MNTSFHQGPRALEINLDIYTDGDPILKRELVTLMIDNIRELQQSLLSSIQNNSLDMFKKTSHKVKPTISMVNDHVLTDAIEEIKLMQNHDNKQEKVSTFQRLCNDIIKLLENS